MQYEDQARKKFNNRWALVNFKPSENEWWEYYAGYRAGREDVDAENFLLRRQIEIGQAQLSAAKKVSKLTDAEWNDLMRRANAN